MNLREQFAMFMTGSIEEADLIKITKAAMETIKSLPIFERFQKAKKLVGIEVALKQIFANQKSDGDIRLDNIQYDYYQEPQGFLAMVQNLQDCTGKAILLAHLLNDGNHKIQFGEVLEDWFANLLLKRMTHPPVDILREAIYYELPHAVVVIDGQQIDPLSYILPTHMHVEHGIMIMDLQVGILGGCAVNFCNSQPFDPLEAFSLLSEIFDLGNRKSSFVARNIISKLLNANLEIPDELIKTSSCQVSLEVMITRSLLQPKHRDEIIEKIKTRYGRNIWQYIHSEPQLATAFRGI